MRAAVISLGSESSKAVAAAMKEHFSVVDELQLKDVEINFSGKRSEVLYQGKPLAAYDCIYAKGSFRYAQLLCSITSILSPHCYMPIRADAFTVGHDKLLTQLSLQNKGIPMPRTYLSATVTAARNILKSVSYPVVTKFPQGTQGKGVVFADSYASASSVLDAMDALRQPVIIQEYIDTNGIDVRAIVVGDKVVAAMQRKASVDENRANLHAGGNAESYNLDEYTRKLAIRTAECIGAEICGVDILESAKGPVVLEANISPGLAISQITGVDVAAKIAKYLHAQTKQRKDQHEHAEGDKLMSEVSNGAEPAQELITSLKLRGDSIVLPGLVTKITGFDEFQDVEMSMQKGKLSITKL